jgi:hypothetical protein
MKERMEIIKALEKRIKQLQEWEWIAKEAKDYPACLQLQGAIIHFKKFLEGLKNDIRNGNS